MEEGDKLIKYSINIVEKLVFAGKFSVYAVLYFFSKLTARPEVTVLMYHSVSPSASKYSVSPSEFYRQMEYLSKNYQVVSVNRVLDFIEGKTNLPKKAVAITFDDGYLDNYKIAYPILRRKKLPATIFITTKKVQREMCLGELYLPMLTWNQIIEMNNYNVEIGAHTLTHPDLCQINIQDVKKEILESKREIEKRSCKQVEYFTYPFGRFRNEAIEVVRACGYRCAFGGEGTIRKNINRYAVPRVEVKRSIGFAMFKMRLTAAIDWYTILLQTINRALNNSPFIASRVAKYREAHEYAVNGIYTDLVSAPTLQKNVADKSNRISRSTKSKLT